MSADSLAAFRASLGDAAPPAGWQPGLRALWHLANGRWDAAHAEVENEVGAEAAWVHAHLHRVEGDLGNAGYWYRRAGRPAAAGNFEQERDTLVVAFLGVDS